MTFCNVRYAFCVMLLIPCVVRSAAPLDEALDKYENIDEESLERRGEGIGEDKTEPKTFSFESGIRNEVPFSQKNTFPQQRKADLQPADSVNALPRASSERASGLSLQRAVDISRLMERMDALEKRVKELEARKVVKEREPSPQRMASIEPEAWGTSDIQKAKALLSKGQLREARERLVVLATNTGKVEGVEALFWLGVVSLLQDSEPKKASSYFVKSYKGHEQLPDSLKNPVFLKGLLLKLFQSLEKLGDTKGARAVIKKFSSMSPGKTEEEKALDKRARALFNRAGGDASSAVGGGR